MSSVQVRVNGHGTDAVFHFDTKTFHLYVHDKDGKSVCMNVSTLLHSTNTLDAIRRDNDGKSLTIRNGSYAGVPVRQSGTNVVVPLVDDARDCACSHREAVQSRKRAKKDQAAAEKEEVEFVQERTREERDEEGRCNAIEL